MIAGKGINHATINRIKDYSIEHFASYCDLVRKEFKDRNYKICRNAIEKLNKNIDYENLKYNLEVNKTRSRNGVVYYDVDGEPLFENFHNQRYIIQSLYFFQEKVDCNMITEQEWGKMVKKFQHLNIPL